MIAGIGIDIIALARIERVLQRSGDRFLERVFTAREREEARGDLVGFLAGRFAAKEAALKALGTGLTGGLRWRDIEVLRQSSGAPELRVHGAARARLRALGVTDAQVSLTHDREHAAAIVVLQTGGAVAPTEPIDARPGREAVGHPAAHEAGGGG